MATTVVQTDVSLATTDLGGPGSAVVLMHGLGDSQRTVRQVASQLAGRRVILMDLRGHGRSSTGPFSWEHAVADVRAVVDAYGLHAPFVGGHSLGGMVALQYAMVHPVAGVVNIDGWGPGLASRYLGEDTTVVQARLDRIAGGELPSRLARFVAGRSRQSKEGTTTAVLRLLHDADVVAWHRAAPCRSLAFNATAPAGRAVRLLMGDDMTRMQDAHRAGLRRDLAVAAQEQPLLTVVEVDATHGLCRTQPAVVAGEIRAFCA